MRQAANSTETAHQSDSISATQAAISQTLHISVIALQQGVNNLHAFSTNPGDAMLELVRQTQPAIQRRPITGMATHVQRQFDDLARMRIERDRATRHARSVSLQRFYDANETA